LAKYKYNIHKALVDTFPELGPNRKSPHPFLLSHLTLHSSCIRKTFGQVQEFLWRICTRQRDGR